MNRYGKYLSKNDLGLTGSHQGGICIPKKNKDFFNIFPVLDPKVPNPRAWIECTDPDGTIWDMCYIYYNNKIHGKGTRNEFRITHMTKFFRFWEAQPGDQLILELLKSPNVFRIKIEKKNDIGKSSSVVKLKGWNRVH